jgi:sporulation protein YlmC with PRC-barrel domain
MRLSEILHSEVLDENDRRVGTVADVRLVQDGPLLGAFAALRVEGLVVGGGSLGVRLGFHRADVKGPWPLKALFGAMERKARFVPWDRVSACDGQTVRIRGTAADLPWAPVRGAAVG